MSILVTGNKGFIASGIKNVDGIDIKDGVDIVTYKAPSKNYHIVIHTAALTSVYESNMYKFTYFKTNVTGTANMIQQYPTAHFVYLSTAGVYGEGSSHTVQSPVAPSSIYAWTKWMGENVVRNLAKSWCILRLTNVIGEGERGEPNVYQVFQKSDVLPIYGDGLQTRDFIHVDKVRQAILWALDKQGVYNVGSGISKTILDVAKEFNKPIKFFPARECEIRNFGVKDAFHNFA